MNQIRTERTGIIFDIDHFAVHDGNGIRTCVYLKGCPLHCEWCHSPESQKEEPEILFAANRCTGCGLCTVECPRGLQKIDNGIRIFERERCILCGACVSACQTGALSLSGKRYTVSQISRELLADKPFFESSGGGVTVSGGEVLAQADFVIDLLHELKRHNIHTIVETSGYGEKEALLTMSQDTDIFYYDYKLGDKKKFEMYVGGDLDVVLENLRALRNVTEHIVLRAPMIPGITDTEENVKTLYRLAQELSIKNVHFLPYNASAGAKYQWCGREYALKELSADKERIRQYCAQAPKHIHAEMMD